MKDLLEPFLYPHNLLLYGLLVACICYKKKGLWLLFVFYYVMGNTYIANHVRHWYSNTLNFAATVDISGAGKTPAESALYIVLGCGGSATQLPACASARLQRLSVELADVATKQSPAAVLITTRYCQPYLDALAARQFAFVVDCYDAGENTYQEFASLAKRLQKSQPLRFITSDFHGWRVRKLITEYQFNASVGVAQTQTFRAVNCSLNCLFTINLTNLDFYSKLIAEFSSYAIYRFGGARFTGEVSG
ncbi:hypothetical protein ACO1PK_16245 [Alishewanella sp. d11]|uniref:hypothetical protein n=1 Tax=Alishewanella sp. d11 TaxID=3414030 RepID=UPI003BF87647